MMVTTQTPFKWRHFLPNVILLNVRWYRPYALSYRDLEEMMLERGVEVDHTTLYRWVQGYCLWPLLTQAGGFEKRNHATRP